MAVTRSIVIHRDPSGVFRWIADPELASRWQPEVAGYEITAPREEVVGTEFRERLRGSGGTAELHGRVTAYEPDARMAFELAGRGIRVRASYALTAVASGTRLDVATDLRVGGPLSWLLAPLVRRRAGRQLDAELARLRELAEAAD